MRIHLIRGSMSSLMAILFFWGLARVPLAQGVALAFVAPLIALYLAALILKEKIERRAILASMLGFAGVLVILAGQAEAEMGPDAFRGALAILVSAALYAWNIILMRQQAQVARPVEIAFFTSGIMCLGFVLVAPFLAVLPRDRACCPAIVGAALLAFGSLILLSWAYARAEAQYLAPVEYTAFVWASLLGYPGLRRAGAAPDPGRRGDDRRRLPDRGAKEPATASRAGSALERQAPSRRAR